MVFFKKAGVQLGYCAPSKLALCMHSTNVLGTRHHNGTQSSAQHTLLHSPSETCSSHKASSAHSPRGHGTAQYFCNHQSTFATVLQLGYAEQAAFEPLGHCSVCQATWLLPMCCMHSSTLLAVHLCPDNCKALMLCSAGLQHSLLRQLGRRAPAKSCSQHAMYRFAKESVHHTLGQLSHCLHCGSAPS